MKGCCGFFITYYERYMRWIHKNAFIDISIGGAGFCDSSKSAYFLMLRNEKACGKAAELGWVLIRFGEWFMGAVAGLVTAYMLSGK